ncbi:MAG TPA: glycosyltransferase [Alphaproteobacteria bacterium]|nr:glycosyltransferase [Alphaproteobacteria bacterium]
MKQTIKISVIIPVYNAEKFLEKCLEHIVHQTYKNLEIIIVDDGSTDNSPVIYNQYAKKDKRIKIKKQKNSGPAVALNTGLLMATGDYIHFHDHDDFVNLDYYELMAKAAETTNSDILCGEVNQPGYNFPEFDNLEICCTLEDKILKTRANRFHPAWRYLYKKEFLDRAKLKYEPAIFGKQDIIFTRFSIVLANNITLVPKAKYNVIESNATLSKNMKKHVNVTNTDKAEKVWIKYHNFLTSSGAIRFFKIPESPFIVEKFKMFNINIFSKEFFIKKIRYYLFGIQIGTKKINY